MLYLQNLQKFKKLLILLVCLTLIMPTCVEVYAKPAKNTTAAKKEDDDKKKTDQNTAKDDTKASSGKLKLENDGKARKNAKSCYGQSKEIPVSFEGVDYYDCYIPYTLTLNDIGGWISNASGVGDPDMGSAPAYLTLNQYKYLLDTPVGNHISTWGLTGDVCESIGVSNLKSDNHIRAWQKGDICFYFLALPEFFYKNKNDALDPVGSEPYCSWGLETHGYLVDVVLTSGDVIHFIIVDNNSESHSNGPSKNDPQGTNSVKSKLNYKQYAHIFNGTAGNLLEIAVDPGGSGEVHSAGASAFRDKFNLKPDSNVHIAFIRMYNAKYSDDLKVSKKAANKNTYFNLDVEVGANNEFGDPTGNDGGDSDSPDAADKANQNANGNPVEDKYIPEDQLVGLEGQFEKLNKTAKDVELAKREDFSEDELTAIETVRKGQKAELIAKITYWVRVVTVFMGLLIILYGGMMLLAYLFDRANNFFDISLLSMVTLGNLSATDGLEGKSKHELAPSRVIASSIIVIAAGCFIVSGAEFLFIHNIYSWIEGIVK